MKHQPYPAVGAAVVQRILLVDHYDRQGHHHFESTSLPGHLIQLMLTGQTRHQANGRTYDLRPGSLIWYHENELVRGQVIQPPWSFYTLNFIAPALSPPAFESRVKQVGAKVKTQFTKLLRVWREVDVPPAVREMRVQAGILELLAMVWGTQGQLFQMDPSSQLWWEMETWLRGDLSRPVSLTALCERFGKSPATVARSCLAAVGDSPMKRIKAIRMSMAHGLVTRSDLRIKEIATRVGYARVHEFSRDYRLAHGQSPRAHRAAGK